MPKYLLAAIYRIPAESADEAQGIFDLFSNGTLDASDARYPQVARVLDPVLEASPPDQLTTEQAGQVSAAVTAAGFSPEVAQETIDALNAMPAGNPGEVEQVDADNGAAIGGIAGALQAAGLIKSAEPPAEPSADPADMSAEAQAGKEG